MKGSSTRRSRRKTDGQAKARTQKGSPVVFVSPSGLPSNVKSFAPTADVRGPIRRGDLDAMEPGRLVAIVDGFDGDLAVTAREVRSAVARGVRVVGGGGLGALRAAEVHQMVGVGKIYELCSSGELIRDDEVIVWIDHETGRYKTEPLVNVRFSVSQLAKSGTLSEKHADAIVQAASAMHFRDRTYRNILRAAGLDSKGDSTALVDTLKAIDLKRDDILTLLEQLAALDASSRWSSPSAARHSEAIASFDKIRLKKNRPADQPLFIWEDGQSIHFERLVRFIALTGRLDAYVRRLPFDEKLRVSKQARKNSPSAQDLIEDIGVSWGWNDDVEMRVTLNDLGFGSDDFFDRVRNEQAARLRSLSASSYLRPSFLRGLRFELLVDDLALKREALRLGALQWLAEGAQDNVTKDEATDAKRALLAVATRYGEADTWSALSTSFGWSKNDVTDIVALVATARRRGVPLLETLDGAAEARGIDGAGLGDLPDAFYVAGTSRSVRNEDAAAIAKKVGEAAGITRVAQLSEFDRVGGLHVTAAYRAPSGRVTFGGGLGSGKSESLDGAIVGAVMEETEKYCQEIFEPADVVTRAFEDWDPDDAADPGELYLPYDSAYRPKQAIAWTATTDLVSGRQVHVPLGALVSRRVENDPYFSPRLSRKWFSPNGLASGFSLTEALHHALCERIERHAYKLSELEAANPGNLPGHRSTKFHVDLDSCPPSTRRICTALKTGGWQVRVADITCEVTVPTFNARVFRPGARNDGEPSVVKTGEGCCAHPNPEIAINRAILEGVQTILINVSGAFDLAMNVRSLGRHERPRPFSRGERGHFQPWVPKRPFDARQGFSSSSARQELAFIVRRLTAAAFERVLYRDLSTAPTMPARIVRAIIPGMEDTCPLFTGARARARVVSDLMRRHDW